MLGHEQKKPTWFDTHKHHSASNDDLHGPTLTPCIWLQTPVVPLRTAGVLLCSQFLCRAPMLHGTFRCLQLDHVHAATFQSLGMFENLPGLLDFFACTVCMVGCIRRLYDF